MEASSLAISYLADEHSFSASMSEHSIYFTPPPSDVQIILIQNSIKVRCNCDHKSTPVKKQDTKNESYPHRNMFKRNETK